MIKIITWNILSPFYANAAQYVGYNPEVLSHEYRKIKVLEIVRDWIKQNEQPIINLQEVPLKWRGELESLFYQNDYTVCAVGYGKKKNGYFGILTAFPNKYKMENLEYIPIGHYVKNAPINEVIDKTNKTPFDKIKSFINTDEMKDPRTIIRKAKARDNVAIRLHLNKDYPFIVYNYHMPLSVTQLQILHTDVFKRLITDHKNIPTILAMDSNLIVNDDGYNYFTKGVLPDSLSVYLEEVNKLKLISSYKQVNKREPSYTNYSISKFGGNFKDTIDYIMITDHFNTLKSQVLFQTNEKLPNLICPSDHLPLESILEKKY